MTRTSPARRWIRRGAALAAVAGALTVVPAATAQAQPSPVPAPVTCPATRVASAELVRTVNGPAILVKGLAAGPNLDLQLVPEDVVYIQQPDYWRYFVVDCAPDAAVVKTPYSKLFRVPTAPVGRYGIEIGADQINL